MKDDNIGEKKVPQLRGVSISDNAPAFQRSVNNLATLAYATEGNLLRGIVNFLDAALSVVLVCYTDLDNSFRNKFSLFQLDFFFKYNMFATP